MTRPNRGYIDGVDRLIEECSLEAVLAHFGQPLPEKERGEHRMPCCFSEGCQESSYGSMTVNLADPAKVIFCHSCGVRGNLLTLIHGLTRHAPPATGKLRGAEFKESVETLQRIRRVVDHSRAEWSSVLHSPTPPPQVVPLSPTPVSALDRNIPLQDQEKTRGLVNLWEDLIVDPAVMPPPAARYFRERPWLTPEVCRHWKMGYLPRDGRSLFRGHLVYAHTDEQGDILTYSARDPAFAEKWSDWVRDGRPENGKPAKHRYVKGYSKGLELYGQSAERLVDRRLKESLGRIGLIVVEGMNDVIRFDRFGIAAVGLCSNRATSEQIEKLDHFARRAGQGRVVLFPDNDDEGEAGFKELLWALAERGLDVRLGWSRRSHAGQFDGRQPEEIAEDDWEKVLLPGCVRSI